MNTIMCVRRINKYIEGEYIRGLRRRIIGI